MRWLLAGCRHPVIFDIGACEGEDSIRYARRFPGGRVFSFEPLPANQELIRLNFARYRVPNAELVPLALSDRAGPAAFHVSAGRPQQEFAGSDWNYGNKSSSLLAPASDAPMHGWIEFPEQIEVPCETLDAFCAGRGIDRIEFIHMDVQGAEGLVLAGAARMLTRTGAIWLEVAGAELYCGQKLRREIGRLLVGQGFWLAVEEMRGVEGDQLYVRRGTWRGLAYRARWRGRAAVCRLRRVAAKCRRRAGLAARILTEFDDDARRCRVKVSFAQNGEDLIAWNALSGLGLTHPRYLDIGAHHPEHLSNTALFHRLGASGMNIEPDPDLFAAFRRARRGDINLNFGVGATEGVMTFFRLALPALNTFSQAEAERIAATQNIPIVGRLQLPVRPIARVLDEHGFRPDFLTIDTEGYDLEILRGYDFVAHRPAVICAETLRFGGGKNTTVIDFIVAQGYRVHADTAINTIFIDERRPAVSSAPPTHDGPDESDRESQPRCP